MNTAVTSFGRAGVNHLPQGNTQPSQPRDQDAVPPHGMRAMRGNLGTGMRDFVLRSDGIRLPRGRAMLIRAGMMSVSPWRASAVTRQIVPRGAQCAGHPHAMGALLVARGFDRPGDKAARRTMAPDLCNHPVRGAPAGRTRSPPGPSLGKTWEQNYNYRVPEERDNHVRLTSQAPQAISRT